MERGEITATSLSELSIDEIDYILEIAMDTGDWHTPTVSDIKILTQTNRCVYGYCNLSLHNNYHNIEYWFNINSSSINIWKEEYIRNKANVNHNRRIYNIQKLAEILTRVTLTQYK